MIFVDQAKIHLPADWLERAEALCTILADKSADERTEFIESKRDATWGDAGLKLALRSADVVGNKCWYSEVPLVGADSDVDHFRPKGKIKEVDVDNAFTVTGNCDGYWWLAFKWRNFRLSAQHSNQRRVDKDTCGGKWDFFPIDGARAQHPPGLEPPHLIESVLPLDPCSAVDCSLLRFTTEGKPTAKPGATPAEERRVRVSVWLYHLDKSETHNARMGRLLEVQRVVDDLERDFGFFDAGTETSKSSVDSAVAKLKDMMKDSAPFAGAVRCYVKTALKGGKLEELVFGP
jgi:hypothetical protein